MADRKSLNQSINQSISGIDYHEFKINKTGHEFFFDFSFEMFICYSIDIFPFHFFCYNENYYSFHI